MTSYTNNDTADECSNNFINKMILLERNIINIFDSLTPDVDCQALAANKIILLFQAERKIVLDLSYKWLGDIEAKILSYAILYRKKQDQNRATEVFLDLSYNAITPIGRDFLAKTQYFNTPCIIDLYGNPKINYTNTNPKAIFMGIASLYDLDLSRSCTELNKKKHIIIKKSINDKAEAEKSKSE